jgi:hypothetical protein
MFLNTILPSDPVEEKVEKSEEPVEKFGDDEA